MLSPLYHKSLDNCRKRTKKNSMIHGRLMYKKEVGDMERVNVKLNNLESAAKFVEIMERKNVKADIAVGQYCLDAKSLMGILTMDLNKSLSLTLYEDESVNKEIMTLIEQYIA